jgi:ferrous iron transport protein A
MGGGRRRMRKGEGWLPGAGTWADGDGGAEVLGVAEREVATAGAVAVQGRGLERLSELKAGEQATIQGFDAGHGLISRLSVLGFTPQAQVTMLQNFGSGPVIVKMRDTRIALGRGEAMKVWVSR